MLGAAKHSMSTMLDTCHKSPLVNVYRSGEITKRVYAATADTMRLERISEAIFRTAPQNPL